MLETSVPKRLARAAAALLLVVWAAACGGGPSGPPDAAPEITVTGVEAGGTYDGPVTIDIRVDRGSYEATLDGAPFFSGRIVSQPGEHLLVVSARDGTATSRAEVPFTIALKGASVLIVRVIDLGSSIGGGGDAILLTDSSAAGVAHALVDAGPCGRDGADDGCVARRLAALGVDTLVMLQLTHAHADHYQGMPAVLGSIPVRRFVYNGQQRSSSGYTSLLAQARERADTVVVPRSIYELTLGRGGVRTQVAVLPPLPDFLAHADSSSQLNEGSLGTVVRRGDFEMFLAGDGETRANQRWRTTFGERTRGLEALKVGHHGANNAIFDNGFSGASSWLQHTAPRIALISANGTSHPRRNALGRLLAQPDLRTYCTHVHGTIAVRVGEDGGYVVTVERNPGEACTAGSDAET